MLEVFALQGEEPGRSIEFTHSAIDNLEAYPFENDLVILTEGEKLNICDIKSGQIVYSFISGDTIKSYKMFDGFIVTASLDGTIRFCFMSNNGYESDWHRITRPNSITGMEIGSGKIAITCYASKRCINECLVQFEYGQAAEHNDTIDKHRFLGRKVF